MSPAHVTLTPELEALKHQFEHLATDAETLVTPLSDDQCNWRPADDAWSVAECLEHLNVVARLYLPQLDEGIAEAIRKGLYRHGPFRYNWLGRYFARSMEPPVRMRVRTPKQFRPAPRRARQEILAAFRAYQIQYIDRLHQANGLDLARARVSSPVFRWLHIPLGSAFELVLAHERRHLAQARQVVGRQGFPRAAV